MKHTKPTILLISFIFSPNIGGVESHLDDLCAYLTKKGYKIVVITYQPIISKATAPIFEKKNNIEIFRIPHPKFNLFNRLEKIPLLEVLYLTPPILLFSFFYLLKFRKKFNVIQAHGFNMAIVGAILSTVFKIKLTVNTHISFSFDKKSLYSIILRKVLNHASKILVLTVNGKKELVKIGIISEKLVVYHQWIDEKLFKSYDKEVSRKKLTLSKNSFIIFFAGRFVAAKGLFLLLKSARSIRGRIKFIFVGSGPLAQVIKEEQVKNSTIRFIGVIDKALLPYYYSAADISIIPSIQATRTYSEGIPRVLIESLSCGTPVVATHAGGLDELLRHDVGFFIDPEVSSITELIENLIKKKDIWKMRRRCIEYAKEQFGKSKNAQIIERSLL